MSEHSEFLVQRVVKIQVPPEVEHAAKAGDVAALPPEQAQHPACDAIFAGQANPLAEEPRAALDPTNQLTSEEKQAEAAMVIMFAQQLALTQLKKHRPAPEPPALPQREDEEDSEDA